MTQGSVSNRMSIKNGRFANLESFGSISNKNINRNPGSPGLGSRKLRRQNSITTDPKASGITVGSLNEDNNSQDEADFQEINLSMASPYKRPEMAETSESNNKDDAVINPANKSKFAKGLAQLPESKVRGQDEPVAPPVEQESFNNALQYWLTCIGYAVGYGNIWRFPYLLYSNGGGAFLVPYFLSVMLIAIPMYSVETAFGQCYRKQLSQRFSSISPKLWGFSFAQFIVCSLNNLYYVVLMAWSMAYLFMSFVTPLPWVKQTFIGGALDDKKEATGEELASTFFNKDFFSKKMLESTDSIDESGGLVPIIVIALFLSYVLVYFSIWKGVESSGKVVYVTALLPYFLLIIMLLRGLTLEGSGSGLYYLFYPDWSKLGNFKVWRDGVNQVIFSSGIAFGPLVYYSSCRQPNEKILKSSFWLPVINSMTSLLAAMVLFSFLGHVSHTLGISIDEMEIEGIELAFVAYPAMLSMLPGSNIWAVIFFVMLIIIGIDSIFATFDFVMSFLLSEYPIIAKKMRKETFSLLVVLANFIFGLMFCSQQGIYIFQLFDHYAVGLPLLFMELANTIILGWKFDILTLDQMMFNATGERFPKIIFWIVRYALLVIMTISFVVSFISEFSNPLDLPGWAIFFGWCLMMTPIAIALAGFCITKDKLLCCCKKYANTGVSAIEYAHDAEGEKKQNKQEMGAQPFQEGERAVDGEVEMQANIKLSKMMMSNEKQKTDAESFPPSANMDRN